MIRAVECVAPGRWSYRRVHAAACGLALARWLGRWAVFALVATLLVGAGAGLDSALAAVQAVAAWAALPLAKGAAAGWACALAAALACAVFGLGLIAAVRNLLWPLAWREAERALPLSTAECGRSDLVWIAVASTPWAALQGVGLTVWLLQQPAWLAGRHGLALWTGLVSLLLTWAGGWGLQQLRRRGGPAGRRAGWRKGVFRPDLAELAHRRSPAWALIWWPLRRGRAGRFAAHQALTLAGVALLVGAAVWLPAWAPWWLSLQALLSLVAHSRAQVLAALELRPLLESCAPLPLPRQRWTTWIDSLCAAPALVGSWGLALAVAALTPDARGAVLAAWCAWIALALWLELRVPARDAQVQGARWLFMLMVAVALASQVQR